jgi:raffinose/stachyose/melibiose transport system substrate-binding protein
MLPRRFHLGSTRFASCAIAACWLLVSTVLSGCSNGSAAPTRTLQIWYSTDDPVERAWSQQLARRYEQLHPGVLVNLRDYSFEDLNTKLQLALSAGDPPDLAYVTPRGPGIPAYIAAHRLRDLSGPARTEGWAAKLRPGLLAAYNEPFQYFGAAPRGIVAVPTSLAAVGVLYNQRLLQGLHLAVPRTFRAFEAALARAKSAGYTPIGMGNADGWLGDDWYLTLVNATVPSSSLAPEQHLSNSFSFQRPPFVAAANTLQRWSNRGYFTQDFGGMDAQEGVDLFFRGRTLFQLISSSENSQIAQDQRQTRLPIGVFSFPRARGGGVMPLSGYLGWVVPAAAQHPTEAISFIDTLLSPLTSAILERHGVLPAHASHGGAATGALAGAGWQKQYLTALDTAQPGIYLDAAPVANLNATMEANVQLLLQGYEAPAFLVKSLQEVYASHGKHGGSTARIDGEY